MNTKLRRLQPKDFDAALLEELTKKGRVYISLPQVTDNNEWKHEVLDYVRSISDMATETWQDRIADVWQTIVDAECFRDCLSMKRGIHAGHMNRYVVTNLVYLMQNKGVYRNDVPMLTLHLRMEGTKKRNKYYNSSGNYYLNRDARTLLRGLLSRV